MLLAASQVDGKSALLTVPLVIATGVFALMSPLSITNLSALREPTTKSAEDPSNGRPEPRFDTRIRRM